jgi:hypothetical protein
MAISPGRHHRVNCSIQGLQDGDMSVFDPKWKYTQSHSTDIRKTFAKARKDLAKRQQATTQLPKLQLMRPVNAIGSASASQTAPSTPRDSKRPPEHTRTPPGSDKLLGS